MAKLIRLRRADSCATCHTDLPAGTEGFWVASERLVLCVACGSQPLLGATAPGDLSPTADVAAGSAQAMYEKRSSRELAKKQRQVERDATWRQEVKREQPVLGRIAAAITPKPTLTAESQSTRAWKSGAEGERRVAQVLAGAVGVEVLHDRRIPGSRANIDHIAVGPAGVFVIDAKKYTGQITTRDVGGFLRPDLRLFVGRRDQTKLVDGVLRQVEIVRAALGDGLADVPVRAVLCFVGCEWGWVKRAKHVKGVTALWPTALPALVSKSGEHAGRVGLVAGTLTRTLPVASS